jgi:phospholipid/cholesterol/gamma-HCH transport system substrate-binding protein
MENKSHAFIAGLFAIVFSLAAMLVLYWLGGEREASRDYIIVTKQSVGGLNPQAQVRYRGIRVGKVTDIRLDPDDRSNILVSISVDESVPLTRGTVAKLNYQGVTGIAHILLLDAGRDDVLLSASDGKLPRITMVPSLLDELDQSGPASLRQAQQLMANANVMLGEANQRHLTATLANLEQASSHLKPTLDNLNLTLAQVNKLLSEQNIKQLSQAAGQVGPLLADTRLLIGKMQVTTDRLDIAIGNASSNLTSALLPRLNELASDFSLTSRQLGRVLRVIEDTPHSLVLGTPAPAPGPGEPGFSAAVEK